MISEPVSSSAVAVPSAPRKLKIDQRYVAPLIVTTILMVSQGMFGVLESLPQTLTAIATSIVVEIFLSKLTLGKWPHLASAYISGISVGILVRSPEFWPFAACAAISIASKYVIRADGRHIWNPSNFGICVMLLIAHIETLTQQWDNRNYAIYVIWLVGTFTIYRLKRFHICATYFAAFVFFAWIRGFITGHGFLTEVAPITGPMYQLFIFFMITDPKTTVFTKRGQILVAFCVAAMEMVLRSMQIFQGQIADETLRNFVMNIGLHAPYFALFTVGPIANMLEIWNNRRKSALTAAQPETAVA